MFRCCDMHYMLPYLILTTMLRWVLYYYLFYKLREWGPDRVIKLVMVTQLASCWIEWLLVFIVVIDYTNDCKHSPSVSMTLALWLWSSSHHGSSSLIAESEFALGLALANRMWGIWLHASLSLGLKRN